MLPRTPVRIETERLVLTMPPPTDAARVVRYFDRNREHLEPWDPPRPARFYSAPFWRRQLERNRLELLEGRSMRLFLLSRDEEHVVGTLNFTNIVRGAFQACNVGYGLDAAHQGQGLMREALSAAVTFAFRELGLHRVMANYMPENARSARLLRATGFVVEGYARDYLFIGGAWRDHVLTAITNPEPGPPGHP